MIDPVSLQAMEVSADQVDASKEFELIIFWYLKHTQKKYGNAFSFLVQKNHVNFKKQAIKYRVAHKD